MCRIKGNNEYMLLLKSFVLNELKDVSVKIILFGSRSRGEQSIASDVDVGIIPKESINKQKITVLKEKVENLNIPYTVDFVDLSEAEENFKQEILKDAVIWKD